MEKIKCRCRWCNMNNPAYVKYHDEEWGVLKTDEHYLFEMLILESFEAGLSWECILNKREAFRRAFEGFDPDKVMNFNEEKQEELLQDRGIVRNRLKIRASVKNAAVFKDIQREYGSFDSYLKKYCGTEPVYETGKTVNAASDAIAADLKRRGMKFCGSTTVYAYLQAVGRINSHERGCFKYGK